MNSSPRLQRVPLSTNHSPTLSRTISMKDTRQHFSLDDVGLWNVCNLPVQKFSPQELEKYLSKCDINFTKQGRSSLASLFINHAVWKDTINQQNLLRILSFLLGEYHLYTKPILLNNICISRSIRLDEHSGVWDIETSGTTFSHAFDLILEKHIWQPDHNQKTISKIVLHSQDSDRSSFVSLNSSVIHRNSVTHKKRTQLLHVFGSTKQRNQPPTKLDSRQFSIRQQMLHELMLHGGSLTKLVTEEHAQKLGHNGNLCIYPVWQNCLKHADLEILSFVLQDLRQGKVDSQRKKDIDEYRVLIRQKKGRYYSVLRAVSGVHLAVSCHPEKRKSVLKSETEFKSVILIYELFMNGANLDMLGMRSSNDHLWCFHTKKEETIVFETPLIMAIRMGFHLLVYLLVKLGASTKLPVVLWKHSPIVTKKKTYHSVISSNYKELLRRSKRSTRFAVSFGGKSSNSEEDIVKYSPAMYIMMCHEEEKTKQRLKQALKGSLKPEHQEWLMNILPESKFIG